MVPTNLPRYPAPWRGSPSSRNRGLHLDHTSRGGSFTSCGVLPLPRHGLFACAIRCASRGTLLANGETSAPESQPPESLAENPFLLNLWMMNLRRRRVEAGNQSVKYQQPSMLRLGMMGLRVARESVGYAMASHCSHILHVDQAPETPSLFSLNGLLLRYVRTVALNVSCWRRQLSRWSVRRPR